MAECRYPPYKYYFDKAIDDYVANPCWDKCGCNPPIERKKRKRHANRDDERKKHLRCEKWKAIVCIVRERDGFMCVECGAEKHLTTHHVDFSKYNDDIDNLVTLCWRCHSQKHWKTHAPCNTD